MLGDLTNTKIENTKIKSGKTSQTLSPSHRSQHQLKIVHC